MSDDPTEYDLSAYLWLVIVGAFGSFFASALANPLSVFIVFACCYAGCSNL